MKFILEIIGIIVASVCVGVITGIVFKSLGATDFVIGQAVGLFSVITTFVLLDVVKPGVRR